MYLWYTFYVFDQIHFVFDSCWGFVLLGHRGRRRPFPYYKTPIVSLSYCWNYQKPMLCLHSEGCPCLKSCSIEMACLDHPERSLAGRSYCQICLDCGHMLRECASFETWSSCQIFVSFALEKRSFHRTFGVCCEFGCLSDWDYGRRIVYFCRSSSSFASDRDRNLLGADRVFTWNYLSTKDPFNKIYWYFSYLLSWPMESCSEGHWIYLGLAS